MWNRIKLWKHREEEDRDEIKNWNIEQNVCGWRKQPLLTSCVPRTEIILTQRAKGFRTSCWREPFSTEDNLRFLCCFTRGDNLPQKSFVTKRKSTKRTVKKRVRMYLLLATSQLSAFEWLFCNLVVGEFNLRKRKYFLKSFSAVFFFSCQAFQSCQLFSWYYENQEGKQLNGNLELFKNRVLLHWLGNL